jgi:hypothetical protein
MLHIPPMPGGQLCYPAWTIGNGDLVIMVSNGDATTAPTFQWGYFDRDGVLISQFASPPTLGPGMTAVLGGDLWYDSVRMMWRPILRSFAPDGSRYELLLDRYEPFFHFAGGGGAWLPSPAVGTILADREISQADGSWRTMVWVMDEHANVCGVPWKATSGTGDAPYIYAGVDSDLNVLVFYEGDWLFPGEQTAQWYSIDGKPLTPRFSAPVGRADCGHGCETEGIVPLIGGGFAYAEGLQWRAFFPSKAARMEPAPAWLQDYFGHELYPLGDRGYAAVPNVSLLNKYSFPCADHIDFISATGESCGTMKLESPLSCARIYVGRDGTVFQASWAEPEKCHLAVWDYLLR